MSSKQLILISFGYKYSTPDADLTIDVREWPNPYWDEKLAPLTGLDQPIVDFFAKENGVLNDIENIRLNIVQLTNQRQGETHVAIGCTGGQHRSVFAVEKLAKQLSDDYSVVRVEHRERPKW